MKKLCVLSCLFFALMTPAAFASNCSPNPYTLTNGTNADASQVMANFNNVLNCANNNLAHNGANSDITSLTGLTTPLSAAQGGTGNTTGQPGGGAGGDLSGTYPNPTVASTHLSAALPVTQGGTGNAAVSANQVYVGNGTNSATTSTVPGCQDTGGNHLNYNNSTQAFSCGTTVNGPQTLGSGRFISQAYGLITLPSGYAAYEIYIFAGSVATNSVTLQAVFQDIANGDISTGNEWALYHQDQGGNGGQTGSADSSVRLTYGTTTVSNIDTNITAKITVTTDIFHQVIASLFQVKHIYSGNTSYTSWVSGSSQSIAANSLSGVKIRASSGNISFSYRVVGIQ